MLVQWAKNYPTKTWNIFVKICFSYILFLSMWKALIHSIWISDVNVIDSLVFKQLEHLIEENNY